MSSPGYKDITPKVYAAGILVSFTKFGTDHPGLMNKIAFALLFLFVLPACHRDTTSKLTIAASANMQYVIKELAHSFFEITGVESETVVASSGKLTAMIQEGAPFDIFVSADMMYPEQLYENGFALEAPEIYAYGHLVLWSMKEGTIPKVDQLPNADIRHIALANPKTAPYGKAALEVLKHHNLYKTVEKKLVFGESISQTNQFILSGAAELGFTAKSVVVSPALKEKGTWTALDPGTYRSIAQGVILLKNRDVHIESAKRFYDFLFSKEAQEKLLQYGYSLDP